MSVGPPGLNHLSFIPGAARFALAPGYLLAAPSALNASLQQHAVQMNYSSRRVQTNYNHLALTNHHNFALTNHGFAPIIAFAQEVTLLH